MNMEHKVRTFFYGSYINFKVLKEVDLIPQKWEVAILHGYDIQIQPLANIFPSARHYVYGILTMATHAELKRLYNHAEHVLGGIYLPEAVMVSTLNDQWVTALCYISHDMKPAPPAVDYVDRIVKPAREYNFPDAYVSKLERFKQLTADQS